MSNKHIVIFEEDPALAQLYATMLDRYGYVTHRANTLPDMQYLIGIFPIELLIANMPTDRNRMSDLLSQHRLLQAKGTRMVIISGDERNKMLCDSLGIPFYPTPVSTQALQDLINGTATINPA